MTVNTYVMRRQYFILLVFALFYYSCKSRPEKIYDEKILVFQEYKNKYSLGLPDKPTEQDEYPDSAFGVIPKAYSGAEVQEFRNKYMDSALIVLNEIEDQCPMKRNEIRMLKSEIYFFKQDYTSAIKSLSEVDGGLPFDEFKDILIDKVKVKQAKADGDSILLNTLYEEILGDYEKYYHDTEEVLKPFFRKKNADKIYFSWANTVLVEMYHYKLLLKGQNEVLREIDSLQSATKGNEEYFARLKNLFIHNNYEVLYE